MKLQLARNAFSNLLGAVVPALVALGTVPLVVKGLGDASYGVYSLVTAIVGYFAVIDINVTAEKGVLAVRGERRSQKLSSGDGYERVERASGTFLRRFTLPESADAEAIKASHVNGVLEISIPKRPQEQPRRIAVQAA